MNSRSVAALLLLATIGFAGVPRLVAQSQPVPPAPAGQPPATTEDKPPLKPEEIEQLVAPVALYPDSLLTQVLMASTYPIEVVQADRWVKANSSLKGDALATELEKQSWDASVKSLVNFPTVLAMMSEKLDITVKLGDAFLGQQKDVMDAVQRLRGKANAQGNLKSNEQQNVKVTQGDTGSQVIVIEPAKPEVIYVPSYSPTVVYGSWPYPAYPPYPYYPPGYVASNVVSFGVGLAVGAAWGYAWGNSNWGHGDVDIDVNRNTNINNKIDRSKYQNNMQRNNANVQGGKGSWKHDSSHRGGVAYRDNATANRVGSPSATNRAGGSSDAFRGRTDSARPSTTGGSPSRGGADRSSGGIPAPSNRAGGSSSAFDGASRSGSSERAASQRGQSSRSSSSGGSGGGGGRSSGGGGRSGGGGGRGGGGRR